jgi:ribosomal protein S27E
MSVMNGCRDSNNTPIMREVPCPVCKETLEVFTKDSRVVQDVKCDKCGHVIKEGEYI